MKPRKLAVKELLENGYALKRHGSGHDIYFNKGTKGIIPLKRHDFDENDLKYIRKEIESQKGRPS